MGGGGGGGIENYIIQSLLYFFLPLVFRDDCVSQPCQPSFKALALFVGKQLECSLPSFCLSLLTSPGTIPYHLFFISREGWNHSSQRLEHSELGR